MSLKIGLKSRLDGIPYEGWTKKATQEVYYDAADKLIDMGMDEGDAVDFLCNLYNAAAREFGGG